jgi:hypothetical protein
LKLAHAYQDGTGCKGSDAVDARVPALLREFRAVQDELCIRASSGACTRAELSAKAAAIADAVTTAVSGASSSAWQVACGRAMKGAASGSVPNANLRAALYEAASAVRQSYAPSMPLLPAPWIAVASVLSNHVTVAADPTAASACMRLVAVCSAIGRGVAHDRMASPCGSDIGKSAAAPTCAFTYVRFLASTLREIKRCHVRRRFGDIVDAVQDVRAAVATRRLIVPIIDPATHTDPLGLRASVHWMAAHVLLTAAEAIEPLLPDDAVDADAALAAIRTLAADAADAIAQAPACPTEYAAEGGMTARGAALLSRGALLRLRRCVGQGQSLESARREAKTRSIPAAKTAVRIARNVEEASLRDCAEPLHVVCAAIVDMQGNTARRLAETVAGAIDAIDDDLGIRDETVARRSVAHQAVDLAARFNIVRAAEAALTDAQNFVYGEGGNAPPTASVAAAGEHAAWQPRANSRNSRGADDVTRCLAAHRTTLGLPGTDGAGRLRYVSQKELARAYRREAARWHPDALSGLVTAKSATEDSCAAALDDANDAEDLAYARARFLRVTEAFEALTAVSGTNT